MIAVSPGTWDFGTYSKGGLPVYRTVTVSNTGTAAAAIATVVTYTSGSASGGQFKGQSGTCGSPANVPAGSSCTVSIVYTPSCTSGGTRTATVTLQGANYAPATVTVTGKTSTSGVCN